MQAVLVVALLGAGLGVGSSSAAAAEDPMTDDMLASFGTCHSSGRGFLMLYVQTSPPPVEMPSSGNLYVFGQRLSFADAGWLDLAGEGLSAEIPEMSYGGHWIWGLPINLDYLRDPNFVAEEFDLQRYPTHDLTIVDDMNAVVELAHTSYVMQQDCRAVDIPTLDDYRIAPKPKVVFDSFKGSINHKPLNWCIRSLGPKGETYAILNFGDERGSTADIGDTDGDSFVPPEAGTMTFADGVTIDLADAELNEFGQWVVRTPAYDKDFWRGASPALIAPDDEKSYYSEIGCGSPIVIDLDGSGDIQRVEGNVDFDLDANGEAETLSSWVTGGDAILVDRRADGPMNGRHLFGDEGGRYRSGFDKLADLDANDDGAVSGVELDGLALWFDADGDANLDRGELATLDAHGLTSLSLDVRGDFSTAERADGSVVMTEDVWFPIVADE